MSIFPLLYADKMDETTRIDALFRRLNTLESSLYEMSTILSEVRGTLASLNARVTTSTRKEKKSDEEELLDQIRKSKVLDVTELYAKVHDTEVKPPEVK